MQQNSMMKGLIVGGLVVAVTLAGVIYFVLNSKETILIDADRTIEGNYAVSAKQRLVLANGAKLTVTGDFLLEGEIDCQDGAIQLHVGKEFKVSNQLRCVSDVKKQSASGITVSAASFTFEKTSSVISDGSIQMVDRPERVLSETQLEQVYATSETPTGVGQRVGPLSSADAQQPQVFASKPSMPAGYDWQPLVHAAFGVKTAQAQDAPPVVIRGNWQIVGEGGLPPEKLDVQTPNPKVKKVLVYFNFGEKGDVMLQDFTLSGPNGHHGANAYDTCTAIGGRGQDAMRLNVQAAKLKINNLKLILGGGGEGGIARTKTDCDTASATGGDGGKPGNFKMVATQDFQIAGTFEITPGKGGDGGLAEATGKNAEAGCPGKKGGDATARGGRGGDNLNSLSSAGTVGGSANISISDVAGGHGGNAIATAGVGGNGNACGCVGGQGGKATATAGDGGKSVESGASRVLAISEGGDGGDATSNAGHGGNGGSCGPDKRGGNGGNGGDSQAKPGKAGVGGDLAGFEGNVLEDNGGNGGNGGDGCLPGGSGKGGSGKPEGYNGLPGKITCIIEVIKVKDKYLLTDGLHIAEPDRCEEKHWHGTATSTDGTTVADPAPDRCGHCTESQCPVMRVDVKPPYVSDKTLEQLMIEYEETLRRAAELNKSLSDFFRNIARNAPPTSSGTVEIRGGIFGN